MEYDGGRGGLLSGRLTQGGVRCPRGPALAHGDWHPGQHATHSSPHHGPSPNYWPSHTGQRLGQSRVLPSPVQLLSHGLELLVECRHHAICRWLVRWGYRGVPTRACARACSGTGPGAGTPI